MLVYPGPFHGITRPSFVKDRYERYLARHGKYLGGFRSETSFRHAPQQLRWQVLTAIGIALLAGACKPLTPAKPNASRPPIPTSPPSGYVAATRSGPECAAIVAQTASWTTTDSTGFQRPIHRTITTPPFAKGRKVLDRLTVTMRVEETGKVMRDSVFVTGRADASYIRELKAAMATNTFWPAVFEGCAVTARAAPIIISDLTTR